MTEARRRNGRPSRLNVGIFAHRKGLQALSVGCFSSTNRHGRKAFECNRAQGIALRVLPPRDARLEVKTAATQPGTMAPAGQASTQSPQSAHLSESITYFGSPSEMASVGQTSRHAPQVWQSSVITCAMESFLSL